MDGDEFKVLVCGGRSYDNRERLFEVLDKALKAATMAGRAFTLVHGGARGADSLSHVWATMRKDNVTVRVHEADWKTHGRAAGPIRNKLMLTSENPNVIIAFKGGNGTADMIRQAKKAGVDVYEVKDD